MASRPTLILLPGLLCDIALWRHQVETLIDVTDVVVADLIQDDSIGAMAKRVLSGAPERFALGGLSMGGYVAQEIMRQAPDRVERLALIDTSYLPDTPELTERRRTLIEMATRGRFEGVTKRLLPLLIHNDRLDDKALTETVQEMARRVGRDAFVRQEHAIIARPDGTHDLGLIACPTLVLCGRQDALTGVDVHAKMAAGIPQARLVVVEHSGHLSPLEQPQAVSAVLRYWLQV